MRLQSQENLEDKKQAGVFFVIFLIPLIACIYLSQHYFKSQNTKIQNTQDQAQLVLEKNGEEIEEIRIIQGNQAQIDSTWNLLNKWNQGSMNQESATLLTNAGFQSVSPQIDLNAGMGGMPPNVNGPPGPQGNRRQNLEEQQYSKLEANSDKSEFLRVIRALVQIEESEGLTQVEKADLTLPPGVPPYLDRATYLNVELLLSTPNAIR